MTGNELKEKLKKSGLPLKDIADRLEVSRQTVSQYFKSKEVSTGLLERLCAVLGVDMSFFYAGVGSSSAAAATPDASLVAALVEQLAVKDRQIDHLLHLLDDAGTLEDKKAAV